jgi:hypothetical protein
MGRYVEQSNRGLMSGKILEYLMDGGAGESPGQSTSY